MHLKCLEVLGVHKDCFTVNIRLGTISVEVNKKKMINYSQELGAFQKSSAPFFLFQ